MNCYCKEIIDKANSVVQEFSSRDPFFIAKGLGIHIMYVPLCKLKGVYKIIDNSFFIILNQNSTEEMNKIVCAHELGHHFLHGEQAKAYAISESIIYDMSRKYELEANLFAAQLLLDDKTVNEYISDGLDVEKIAMITETDKNLVAIKCGLLINRGYKFIPQEYSAVFLK